MLAISPAGKRIALGTKDGSIKLLSTASGKEIKSFEKGKGPVDCLDFSPDGRYLASASGIQARVWEISSAKVIRQFPDPAKYGTGLAAGRISLLTFLHDGKTLITGLKIEWGHVCDTLLTWDVQNGNVLHKSNDIRYQLAFSPDGRFVAGGGRIVDFEECQKTRQEGGIFLRDFPGTVAALAFSPDSQVLRHGRLLRRAEDSGVPRTAN